VERRIQEKGPKIIQVSPLLVRRRSSRGVCVSRLLRAGWEKCLSHGWASEKMARPDGASASRSSGPAVGNLGTAQAQAEVKRSRSQQTHARWLPLYG
jgi:hypothetical protein